MCKIEVACLFFPHIFHVFKLNTDLKKLRTKGWLQTFYATKRVVQPWVYKEMVP